MDIKAGGDADIYSNPNFSKLISKSEVQELSQINNWRFLASFITEIAVISCTVWLSESFLNPLLYVAAVIIIGSRFHALSVLMHDASHYRAFTNRKLNDFFGEITALVTPFSMEGYRKHHFLHHRELNTDKDPDWVRTRFSDYYYPKKKKDLLLLLGKYALGMKVINELKLIAKEKYLNKCSTKTKILRNLTYIAIILSSILFGFWKELILYWLVPVATSFAFFVYVRGVAEHYAGMEYKNELNSSRTVIAPLWERLLFSPYGVNYHLEHHLYPSVPFYRLKELHKKLMQNSVFKEQAHITHGYTSGLFKESTI